MESTKKLPELISEFSKVAFLYTSNKQFKIEIEKTISFIITFKM